MKIKITTKNKFFKFDIRDNVTLDKIVANLVLALTMFGYTKEQIKESFQKICD
jgi:hypothetical protein